MRAADCDPFVGKNRRVFPTGWKNAASKGGSIFSACQRSLTIVQAFWYNGEKEDRREEEWNSGNRITGETW